MAVATTRPPAMPTLPPAPNSLTRPDGQAAFGVYQGIVPELSWRRLALAPIQRLFRRLHHKRWQYAALAHDDFLVAAAVVDVGWNGTAFAYLFDRRQGK
ncbi:DUF2804 family protein, partial [Chromobacterium violaceum]